MVCNPVPVNALARLKSIDYGTFTPIQVASILALEGPEDRVAEIRENYRRRRDVLIEKPKPRRLVRAVTKGNHVRLGQKSLEAYQHLGSLEFSAAITQRS